MSCRSGNIHALLLTCRNTYIIDISKNLDKLTQICAACKELIIEGHILCDSMNSSFLKRQKYGSDNYIRVGRSRWAVGKPEQAACEVCMADTFRILQATHMF